MEIQEHERSDYVERIVQIRKSDMEYLKKVYAGQVHWLNVIYLLPNELLESCEKQIDYFFYFSISLGKLLDINDPVMIVRGVVQLLEELDHYFSSPMLKFLPNFSSQSLEIVPLSQPFRPTINRKFYQVLLTPTICFALDYSHLLHSTCQLVSLLYTKLCASADLLIESEFVFETFVQLDKRVNVKIIQCLTKHLTKTSQNQVTQEILKL